MHSNIYTVHCSFLVFLESKSRQTGGRTVTTSLDGSGRIVDKLDAEVLIGRLVRRKEANILFFTPAAGFLAPHKLLAVVPKSLR